LQGGSSKEPNFRVSQAQRICSSIDSSELPT